jgi:hypothetical protein
VLTVKRRLLLAGAVLAIMALTGCTAPTAPVGSPSATPSPSSSAGPEAAASVVIGGTAISTLAADGSVIDTAPYLDDAEQAMDLLNDAFQQLPVLTERVTDSSCIADATIATWGDSFAIEYDKEFGPPWGTFDVISTGPAVGDVAVTTQSGLGVGAPLAELEASLPGVHTVLYDYSGVSQVHYDVGGGEWVAPDSPDAIMVDYWGAAALAEGGTVTRLVAPVPYYDAC